MHGNKINHTGKSRVSVDFRILPLSAYDEENNDFSITIKTPMKVNDYWRRN